MKYLKKFESKQPIKKFRLESIYFIENFLKNIGTDVLYVDDFEIDYLEIDYREDEGDDSNTGVERIYRFCIKEIFLFKKDIFVKYDSIDIINNNIVGNNMVWKLIELFGDKHFMNKFIDKLKSLTPEEIKYSKVKEEGKKFGL